jgi:glycosyltransferase involved in cell wall biosynthesis
VKNNKNKKQNSMNLLITTQKVDMNDADLGFFHSWLREFAQHVEKLTVICLYKGEYDLPDNVKVHSLGKEVSREAQISQYQGAKRLNILLRFKYIINFYKYIYQERKNYDKVFVHMNSEYVVLGGVFWKIWKKKISLWYVHRAIPWQLRIAEKFVDNIFTASKESFQLKSNKVKVVGHGIDIDQLKINPEHSGEKLKIESKPKQFLIFNSSFLIVYVGRISRIKNQKLLIEAISLLKNKNVYVKLIGAPYDQDGEKYQEELKELIKNKGLEENFEFVGLVPNKDIYKYYNEADLAINLCPTGGMDKAVLEAMACSTPVMVINKTFANIINEPELILESDQAEELSEKIIRVMHWDENKQQDTGKKLKNIVTEQYGLENLIKKIVTYLSA